MSHARRKVDGGREPLMAKPAGSLATMSERSSHVVSGQSKIFSYILALLEFVLASIIEQNTDVLIKVSFYFSPEKPISPKSVKGFDVPQLTKNYYNVVSSFKHTNKCQVDM